MSRGMNRRRMSPVKIRPTADPKRNNLNADIQRIVNHASKLIVEYNQNSIETLMKADIKNHEKVDLLLKASKESLPKISMKTKSEKSMERKKRKRVLSTPIYHSDLDRASRKSNHKTDRHNSLENTEKTERKVRKGNYRRLRSKSKRFEPDVYRDKRTNTPMSKSPIDNENKNESMAKSGSHSKSLSTACSSARKSSQIVSKRSEESMDNRKQLFVYELEMKTSENISAELEANIWILINGRAAIMEEPILLNDICRLQCHCQPFQRGNIQKLILNLGKYLGSIETIRIKFESDIEDSSFFLDYISLKDCSSGKDFVFPCRMNLGTIGPAKINEITLIYNPPITDEVHSSESNSINRTKKVDKPEFSNEDERLDSQTTVAEDENGSQLSTSQRSLKSTGNESVEKEMNEDLNENPQMEPQMDMNEKSIHKAIETNDFLTVKKLCQQDQDVKHSIDKTGHSPINLAVIYYQDTDDCRNIIDHLLSLNVDINGKSMNGLTSLHHAIINANFPAVKYLIENCKADPTVVDDEGNTSLKLATAYGFRHMVSYLENISRNTSLPKSETSIDDKIVDKTNREVVISDYPNGQDNENMTNRTNDTIDYSKNSESTSDNFNEIIELVANDEGETDSRSMSDSDSTLRESIDKIRTDIPTPPASYNSDTDKENAEEEIVPVHIVKDEATPLEVDELLQSNNSSGGEDLNKESNDKSLDLHNSPVHKSSVFDENVPDNNSSNESIKCNNTDEKEQIKDEANTEDKTPTKTSNIHSVSTENQSKFLNSEDDQSETSEKLLEDQLEEEEIKGIMFYKTIPISKYRKNPSKTTEIRDESQKEISKDHVLQSERKPQEKDDSSSYLSDSKSTTPVSSRNDTMSPITPRTNSDGSSSDGNTVAQVKQSKGNATKESKIETNSITKERTNYLRKETSEQSNPDIMKYDPFPTVNEQNDNPHHNADSLGVVSGEGTNKIE